MSSRADEILERIATLERELETELNRAGEQWRYRLEAGRIRFEQGARRLHQKLKQSIPGFLRESSVWNLLTAPVIYSMVTRDWNGMRAAARTSSLEHMYTGKVVTSRAVTLMLGLWLAATPVLGVFCEMDCDRPPAAIHCHEATGVPEGPTVRSAHHACDHNHTTSSPALLTSVSARQGVGTFVAVPMAAVAHRLIPDARMAMAALHGPPFVSGRSSSSRVTVLRI